MISFELKSDFIELHKLLKTTNLCESGGMAKTLISEGQVKVDDQVELRKSAKIRKGQKVQLADQTVLVQ